MLVRLAGGATNFFDYRELAPGKAMRDMYIKDGKLISDASTLGYRSVAVPGTVAGLELVLKKDGTMKLAEVMAPHPSAKYGIPETEKLFESSTKKSPVSSSFRSATHFSE